MFRLLRRRFGMLLLLAVCLAVGPGCGAIVQSFLESEEELPVKNEAGLNKLAQDFLAALDKKDYAAAYALCSKELKARQTEEAFVAELKNDWDLLAKDAKPQQTETYLYMPHESDIEDWDGFPKDIQYESIQGWITIRVGMKVEGDEFVNGFDIDLFAVDDGSQPKIGYFVFSDWPDESE